MRLATVCTRQREADAAVTIIPAPLCILAVRHCTLGALTVRGGGLPLTVALSSSHAQPAIDALQSLLMTPGNLLGITLPEFLGCAAVGPQWESLAADTATKWVERGLGVNAWVVNTEAQRRATRVSCLRRRAAGAPMLSSGTGRRLCTRHRSH
jgi:hypothetical protein